MYLIEFQRFGDVVTMFEEVVQAVNKAYSLKLNNSAKNWTNCRQILTRFDEFC